MRQRQKLNSTVMIGGAKCHPWKGGGGTHRGVGERGEIRVNLLTTIGKNINGLGRAQTTGESTNLKGEKCSRTQSVRPSAENRSSAEYVVLLPSA